MKKAIILTVSLTFVFGLIIFNNPATSQAGTIRLTWSDYAPPTDDRYAFFKHYIKRIHEETNGEVKITLYPAEQLVKAVQQYEALSRGTVDMVGIVPLYYAGKILMAGMSSEAAYWNPGDSIVIVNRTAREHAEVLAKDGITFMGWSAEIPGMIFIGPKVFRTYADIKGLKMRAPGLTAKVWTHLGATGTHIPNPELYMALQRGVVDAAHVSNATVKSQHLWEVSEAITFPTIGGSPILVSMNTRRWNSLPPEIKAAFIKVNKEMPAWAFRYAVDYNNETNNFIAPKFKTHYFLTEEENEMWNKPFQGFVKNKAIKQLGKPAEELWGKIMNAANEMKDLRAKNQEPVFH